MTTRSGGRRPTLRGRFNAWLLALIDGRMHRIYGRRKRALLGEVPATVVEIGPGSGANLRYYPRGTTLIAVEPNPSAHARLRRLASRNGIELDLRAGGAEHLDLDDASVELVVATLVLCSVEDPAAVLAEVRRVLRPGGRFVFIEHVAAAPGSWLRRLQGWLKVPWRFAFDGCRIDRETAAVVAAAGLQVVEIERFVVKPRLLPVSPHIAGVAER